MHQQFQISIRYYTAIVGAAATSTLIAGPTIVSSARRCVRGISNFVSRFRNRDGANSVDFAQIPAAISDESTSSQNSANSGATASTVDQDVIFVNVGDPLKPIPETSSTLTVDTETKPGDSLHDFNSPAQVGRTRTGAATAPAAAKPNTHLAGSTSSGSLTATNHQKTS